MLYVSRFIVSINSLWERRGTYFRVLLSSLQPIFALSLRLVQHSVRERPILLRGCTETCILPQQLFSHVMQLIISSHPPPRHPSCPILPTTRDCSWMATPSNPSIFVRQMHHGTIIMVWPLLPCMLRMNGPTKSPHNNLKKK